MLQSKWTGDGIELAEVEPGPLAPGHVRLKVDACGICGSDLHSFRHFLPTRPGDTPGHEVVGTVLDGPAGLADVLYAVEPHTRCGVCDLCIAGKRHLCNEGALIGTRIPGGMSEFVDAPAYTVHPVDPSVAPLPASFAEPLAVCVRAVTMARLEVDSRVLVIGAGAIGLLAALLARDRCARVAISARYEHQRRAAADLGVEAVAEADLMSWAHDNGPDVVFETVGGEADTIGQAVKAVRKSGRVIVLGVFTGEVSLNGLLFVVKEVEMLGSVLYGPSRRGSDFAAAVSLLPRYQPDLAPLQTHQYPLRAIHQAFQTALDKTTGAIKVTLLAG